MKTLMYLSYFLPLLFLLGAGCNQVTSEGNNTEKSEQKEDQKLITEWKTDSIFSIPESVYHDSNQEILYISNIDGKPTEKDGKGFISKLSPKGEIINLKWIEGIDAPKGMGVYDGKLYVTNIDEVAEIDISAGEIIERYSLEGSEFANDISINETGEVFISDMNTGAIYKLHNGNADFWLDAGTFDQPNGLFAMDDHLLVGTKNAVMKVDYQTSAITEFISETGSIDGLELVGNGYFIISDWSGSVHLVHPEKEKVLLLNTTDEGINAADISFVPEENKLYVPTFFDNRVMKYELKY
ncbi:MAG: SMP-30/gluconolactonase/LRE family protein [Bacteroidota bacterium]